MKKGGVCKHIQAVRDSIKDSPEAKKKEEDSEKLLSLLREKGEIDSIELIEEFGEDLVDSLIQSGELVEDKGMIRLLG